MHRTRFAIEAMNCAGCVRGVSGVLERLDGVESQQVSIGSAEVSFDPSRISPSAIRQALTKAGYPARQESEQV
jgi:copper chaperone CopZ